MIHLDDQCFGCQYCTLACPYDVPKYQSSRGIVRKCDMCSDRLAVGEAPACVQSCPHEAIAIIVIAAVKLSFELLIFRHLASIRNSPMKRSARLMAGPLSNITFHRFASGFLGGIVLPAMVLSQLHSGQQNEFVLVIMVSMIFVSSVVGELLERYLFFAAVATARMPGGVRT